MSHLRKRWIGNSVVNVLGGFSAAIVSLLMPKMLFEYLGSESYSVWILAIQVTVYLNLLSLGLQNAVATSVAKISELTDKNLHTLFGIIVAGRNISYWSAIFSVFILALIIYIYPKIFPSIPNSLLLEFRIILGLIGCATILQVISQLDMGIFQGFHKNNIFVGIQFITRILIILLIYAGVKIGGSIVFLAFLMSIAMSLQFPLLRFASLRLVPQIKQLHDLRLNRETRSDLLKYCKTYSVFSVSMILINSVGLFIVGRNDFINTGPYAIAMSAALVLVGLLNAILTPLITNAAAMYSNDIERRRLPILLFKTTVITTFILNIIVTSTLLFYPIIIKSWLNESLIESVGPLLIILVIGQCLRNLAAPYSLMMMGMGTLNRATLTAILECITNIIASYLLVMEWGALGVAYGTVIGSLVGISAMFILNFKRTPELTPYPYKFMIKFIILPTIAFIPLNIYILLN